MSVIGDVHYSTRNGKTTPGVRTRRWNNAAGKTRKAASAGNAETNPKTSKATGRRAE
jgi:hypothetical protein